jgi:hypothetical protein
VLHPNAFGDFDNPGREAWLAHSGPRPSILTAGDELLLQATDAKIAR